MCNDAKLLTGVEKKSARGRPYYLLSIYENAIGENKKKKKNPQVNKKIVFGVNCL